MRSDAGLWQIVRKVVVEDLHAAMAGRCQCVGMDAHRLGIVCAIGGMLISVSNK